MTMTVFCLRQLQSPSCRASALGSNVRYKLNYVCQLSYAEFRYHAFTLCGLNCVDHRRAFRTRGLGKKFGLEGYECCLISAYDNAVDIRLNVAKAISLKP